MGRRKESLVSVLVGCPWWVSAALAVLSWTAIVHVAPVAMADMPLFGRLLGADFERVSMGLGGMAAAVFVVCAAVSWRRSGRKKRLLDSRDGIASIRDLSWREFEELVAEAFRREGYRVEENRKAGADGGVDVRLRKDGRLVLVQCKNWRSGRVGVGVVREMLGVMVDEGAAEVVIVCSGGFTKGAWEFSRGKNMRLMGGSALASMIADIRR